VPTIGLAKPLAKALFARTAQHPVTNPIRIRQDYIVGRVTKFNAPSDEEWSLGRDKYIAEWKRKNAPLAVKRWLRKVLKAGDFWVDAKKLNGFKLGELSLTQSKEGP